MDIADLLTPGGVIAKLPVATGLPQAAILDRHRRDLRAATITSPR